jgi:hypothetical protein
MSIWNKILLALIFLASLAFFHAAARTVKTYQHWANKADAFEKALQTTNAKIVSLRTADHEHPLEDKSIGVQQLRIDLGRVLANRGRIWLKCEKTKDPVTEKAGILGVSVNTEESASGAFTKDMLLYVFEEGTEDSPGKYLGEFRVDQVSEKQIGLASTTQMVKSGDLKIKTLADNVNESKTPWVLYEMMPTDEHEAFENVPDDEKKWIPESFAKDSQEGPDGKKEFVRPLRDYLTVFRACEMYRAIFADRYESALRDLSYLQAAAGDSQKQEAFGEKVKTQVSLEKQRAIKELAAVKDHYATLQHMLEGNLATVQALIVNNYRSAQEIARLQKDAVDAIDRRMRSMAQNGPGAN